MTTRKESDLSKLTLQCFDNYETLIQAFNPSLSVCKKGHDGKAEIQGLYQEYGLYYKCTQEGCNENWVVCCACSKNRTRMETRKAVYAHKNNVHNKKGITIAKTTKPRIRKNADQVADNRGVLAHSQISQKRPKLGLKSGVNSNNKRKRNESKTNGGGHYGGEAETARNAGSQLIDASPFLAQLVGNAEAEELQLEEVIKYTADHDLYSADDDYTPGCVASI